LNCSFLKAIFDNLYNAFCIAMVVPLNTLVTLIAIVSILMFILSYFSYSVAMREGKLA